MEDRLFFLQILFEAKSLVVNDKRTYCSRKNLKSLDNNYNENFVSIFTVANKKIYELLDRYDLRNSELEYFHQNTICVFLLFILKFEAKLNVSSDIIKQDIYQYNKENNIDKLLSWKLTFKLAQRNPKWIWLKLGRFDKLINYYAK